MGALVRALAFIFAAAAAHRFGQLGVVYVVVVSGWPTFVWVAREKESERATKGHFGRVVVREVGKTLSLLQLLCRLGWRGDPISSGVWLHLCLLTHTPHTAVRGHKAMSSSSVAVPLTEDVRHLSAPRRMAMTAASICCSASRADCSKERASFNA